MNESPIVFAATGGMQSFVVPATGAYLIEAAGAQGGAGGGPGGKGARLTGTFYLNAGDILQIVVGTQGIPGTTPHQPAGGGGGGTFVWLGARPTPLPQEPLLAAGGGGGGAGGGGLIAPHGGNGAGAGGHEGRGGSVDSIDFHYSGGGGAGWKGMGELGSVPTLCGGGMQWRGGKGANYCCNHGGEGGFGGGGGGAFLGRGAGGGGGYSGGGGGSQHGPDAGGGGSYNAGARQTNLPDAQSGHGCVTILAVPVTAFFSPLSDPARASASPLIGLDGKGYF